MKAQHEARQHTLEKSNISRLRLVGKHDVETDHDCQTPDGHIESKYLQEKEHWSYHTGIQECAIQVASAAIMEPHPDLLCDSWLSPLPPPTCQGWKLTQSD